MAREIHRREDLLRDARALVPRAEFTIWAAGGAVKVVAGFRGESLSLYFGDDPAFHFNAAGELRRAFVGDRLIKAERGRLVALERERSADAVALVRRELDDAAVRTILGNLQRRLDVLRAAMSTGAFTIKGVEPPESDAVPRLGAWLSTHGTTRIAASPRVG